MEPVTNRFQQRLQSTYLTLLDQLKRGAVDVTPIHDNESLLIQNQILRCADFAGASVAEPSEITFKPTAENKFTESASNALSHFFEAALNFLDVRVRGSDLDFLDALSNLRASFQHASSHKSIVGDEWHCVESAAILALSKPGLLAGDIIQTLKNRPDKAR